MVRNLVYWPSVSLKTKSEPVHELAMRSEETRLLFVDLLDTMKHHNGAGLSAIQIGQPVRMFVLNAGEGYECFQNPRLVSCGGVRKNAAEGCLSLPGVVECAMRYQLVTVEGWNQHGEPVTVTAEGFRAQALQHELEHLDGKIFIDGLSPGVRDRARAGMRRAALQGRARKV